MAHHHLAVHPGKTGIKARMTSVGPGLTAMESGGLLFNYSDERFGPSIKGKGLNMIVLLIEGVIPII
jgi:hypothetical protein